MASIRFTVHVDAALPSAVQASITRTIHQHMTLTPGQGGPPAAAAFLAAQAVQELLQAAGVATSTTVRRAKASFPPEVELPEGCARRDCAICLEPLEPGQRCSRPPCLHAFHGPCLRQWLVRSPSCPICKLCLAKPVDGAPDLPLAAAASSPQARELRFRLTELAGLNARELRYVAGYLGISVERGAERPELELLVLGSPSVKILAGHRELLELAVGRLEALLRSVGAELPGGEAEKSELVGALFGSGRFVRDVCTDASEASSHDAQEEPGQTEAGESSSSQGEQPQPAAASTAEGGASVGVAAAGIFDASTVRPDDGEAGPVRRRSSAASQRSAPY